MKRLSFSKYSFTLLLISVALMICLTSCTGTGSGLGTNNSTSDIKGDNKMVLTDRQKDILIKQGLSTNYDDLTVSQKSAIVAIEDMFKYLDNKYSIDFKYLGYVAAGSLDREHLEVYPSDKSSQDVVKVYRDYVENKYIYSDDYHLLEANNLYKEAVDGFLDGFSGIEFKAFPSVTDADENVDGDNVLNLSSASTYVFINEKTCDEGMFSKVASDFSGWIEKESGGHSTSSTTFLLVKSDQFSEITKYNYTNKIYEINEISKKVVIVNLDGKVTIR